MGTADLNYYNVLGVSKTATTSDIKKRYRSLSKQFHPDTTTGDEKKMAQINAAYAVLSDPIKRHRYVPPIIKTEPKATATEPIATKPSYSQRYSTAKTHPREQPNKSRNRPYVNSEAKSDNSWSRAFTYGFTALFLLILAAFAVPAANNYLVAYEAKAADNSPTTQTTDTSQATNTSNTNNPTNQTSTQTTSNDTDSSTFYNETPTAVDATTAKPTDGASSNPVTATTTPTSPESSGTSTNQQPTETQKTNKKWPNLRHNRIIN